MSLSRKFDGKADMSENRGNAVLAHIRNSLDKLHCSDSHRSRVSNSKGSTCESSPINSPQKQEPSTPSHSTIKELIQNDFNKFGSDISLEVAWKILNVEPDNSTRYMTLRKILLSFNRAQFQSKAECFEYMLSRTAGSMDDIAMLLLLFSQKKYIEWVFNEILAFELSLYGEILQGKATFSTKPFSFNEASKRATFAEPEFLRLDEFGIYQDTVYHVKVSQLKTIARLFQGYEESQKLAFRVIFDRASRIFNYFIISSDSNITIIDVSELQLQTNQSKDSSSNILQTEFKELLLGLLSHSIHVFADDTKSLRRFLKGIVDINSKDLKNIKQVSDCQISIADYEKLKFPISRGQLEDLYSEFVYKSYGKAINYESSMGDWNIRPASPEQLHYMALSTFLILQIHEILEGLKFDYQVFESLKKAASVRKSYSKRGRSEIASEMV